MYLERLLVILETISQASPSGEMTVSEIVTATGFPKPSVYRQVNDLVDAGVLEPRKGGRYSIGARVKRISGHQFSDEKIRQLVTPLLKRAAREHGTTFFLSKLSGTSVEIIHAEVPSSGVSYLHPGIGSRPLHACSCSKAIAAFSTKPELHDLLSGRLKAYTAHTKTELTDLQTEFEQIRESGFAECVEELEAGVCSVAAPVMSGGNDIRYSLGATGTNRVFKPEFRAFLGEVLIRLCKETAELLEGRQRAHIA